MKVMWKVYETEVLDMVLRALQTINNELINVFVSANPTGRKFLLDFKFHCFVNDRFAKLNSVYFTHLSMMAHMIETPKLKFYVYIPI